MKSTEKNHRKIVQSAKMDISFFNESLFLFLLCNFFDMLKDFPGVCK